MSNGEDIEQNQNLDMPEQYPDSLIKPVLQALSTTGPGRCTILENAVKYTPEIFKDYRILNALIQDLCDPFIYMASMIEDILEGIGTGKLVETSEYVDSFSLRRYQCKVPRINQVYLIKILKDQFDPKGKKQMAKRMRLIAKIAKETENDWYLSTLEKAKGDVKKECIFALQYSEENIPLLIKLTKKERGKTKDVVYSTLGRFKFENMIAFWKDEVDEPIDSVSNLRIAKSDVISDLIAHYIYSNLEYGRGGDEQAKRCNYAELIPYTLNKTSDRMFFLYHCMFMHKGEYELANFRRGEWKDYPKYLDILNTTMIETLVLSCPKKLVSYLRDILGGYGNRSIGGACFVADLLTLPANKVYKKWYNNPYLTQEQLKETFEKIEYIDNIYYVSVPHYDKNVTEPMKRKVKEQLDSRWFDYMMELKWDDLLHRLAPNEF